MILADGVPPALDGAATRVTMGRPAIVILADGVPPALAAGFAPLVELPAL